jgi:calcineurin-like phosphoesterase family protein
MFEFFRRLFKVKQKRWFVSDTHWYHRNVINYCNRPFKDVEEMNEYLIKVWNKTVAKHDIVYHLGDFSMGNRAHKEVVPRLNGRKYLVSGNHCSSFIGHKKHEKMRRKLLECGWQEIYSDAIYLELKNGELVVLSHLPYKTEDGMKYDNRYNEFKPEDKGAYLLHGHLHGKYVKLGRMIDVGWDAHNKLLSEDEVIALINDPREFIPGPLTDFFEKRAKENLPGAD